MIMFIMRHGEAEPYKEDDRSRQLTDFGVSQCCNTGKWIQTELDAHAPSIASIDAAIVSPYTRTQESFNALQSKVKIGEQQTSELITPMSDAQQSHDYIDALIATQPSWQSMLVVSHMPLVSLLSNELCSGFNARIFSTADALMIKYDKHQSKGTFLKFYQSMY